MSQHNELGKDGEDAAVVYLKSKGYYICDRNWRQGRLELDIVAMLADTMVVVEVKTRTNTECASPEEAVTRAKMRHIVQAADAYLCATKMKWRSVRFDIVTLVGCEGQFRIEHIEDAFEPMLLL